MALDKDDNAIYPMRRLVVERCQKAELLEQKV